ncbi:MAG TPA: hypothetical protein VGC55_16450 [Dokdonella sp.]
MHLRSPLLFTAILFAGVPCAQAALPSTPQPHFVVEYEFFTSDAQYEDWYALTTGLRSDFDDICGDTFCEGDYSNLQPLSFHCSVEQVSGRIGSCIWTFAGSYEEIDAASGAISVDARTWNCPTPLAARTKMTALLAALAVSHPLQAPLPGTQTTIYDGLIDCL